MQSFKLSEKGRIDSYCMLRFLSGLGFRMSTDCLPRERFLDGEERLQKMKALFISRKPFLFQIFIIQKADSI